MKIGIIGTDVISEGKATLFDPRLNVLKDMFNSAKKVYIQVDIITARERLLVADGLICEEKAKLDVIVHDLEFIETRLSNRTGDEERKLLELFRDRLEKEEFLFDLELSDAEKSIVSGYDLWSIKPVYMVNNLKHEEKDRVLFEAYYRAGYISYFTCGEKDSHAWSIPKMTTAYDASRVIHADIQRGFIRAEILSYSDLIEAGSYQAARGKIRLETKDYMMQDGDIAVFRTSR